MYAPNIVLRNLFFVKSAGQAGGFDQPPLSKGLSEREHLTFHLQMIYQNIPLQSQSKSRNVCASGHCTCAHKCRMQQNLVFPLCCCSLANQVSQKYFMVCCDIRTILYPRWILTAWEEKCSFCMSCVHTNSGCDQIEIGILLNI